MILRRRKFLFYFICILNVLIFTGYLVNFNQEIFYEKKLNFDTNKNLLVFLHIQKTGGSDFDRNIVKYLLKFDNTSKNWSKACRNIHQLVTKSSNKFVKFKKFICPRDPKLSYDNEFPSWYFSRQTYGWSCGLHADYTRLKNCLSDKQIEKPLIITILRDPIKRYISEWKHITRGATWNRSKNICNRENQCFKDRNLSSVTLEEFLNCKVNTANNRQTRMLSQYDETDTTCNHLNKEAFLLESAKGSLKELSYFAINEYQNESQWLFEKMFSGEFKFSIKLEQSQNEYSSKALNELNISFIERINDVNRLDVELYNFACKLFFDRINFYRNKI